MELQSGWIRVSNSDTETCPPFAAVEITGHDDDGFATFTRPTANSLADTIYFNGPSGIGPDERGSVYRSFPAHAAYYVDKDGPPRVGQSWGTKANDWFLHSGRRGFIIQADSDSGVVAVVKAGTQAPQAASDNFWGLVNNRVLDVDGRWVYAMGEYVPDRDGTWAGGQRGTTMGGHVVITKILEGNGVDQADDFGISVNDATSGTFKLTIDGNETASIAWDASDADIQAALEAVSSVTFSTPFNVDSDFTVHEITWSENKLKPDRVNPLYEVHRRKIATGEIYRIWEGYDGTAAMTISVVVAGGDGDSAVWSVSIQDVSAGTYVIIYDNVESAAIEWDATSATIQAALDDQFDTGTLTVSNWLKASDGTVTFTLTAFDTEEHEVDADRSELKDKKDFRFRGDIVVDDCGVSLADITGIPGFSPGIAQVLRKSASDCWYLETPEECPP